MQSIYKELLNSASRSRPSAASERARGSTGLVIVICKENKEQKGKRKHHEGAPHPNDHGGFAQWFGSYSLINTLFVWFPASWAPCVAERLFEQSTSPSHHSQEEYGQPAVGLPRTDSRRQDWYQSTHEPARSSGDVQESESNVVTYKIRKGTLPGVDIMPMLNVSSRVTWLELDDKDLVNSYDVLREGILCDVFSQKCSAAWQGAQGQKLTISIMLPGRQQAEDWLDNMLSQCHLWPTLASKGTSTEEISERILRKERRRLRAKHLWMQVSITWDVLRNRMYTLKPTGKTWQELQEMLFDRATKSSLKNHYEQQGYHGPDQHAVVENWKQCRYYMWCRMDQRVPLVPDIKCFISVSRDKEEDARSEISEYMAYCAKRWQTKEGRYQIKRPRIPPDVRDPGYQKDVFMSDH